MQLTTEIKLYPENSVITRYWNIELVNDNKAWIPRLIELHGPTLAPHFHICIPNSLRYAKDFNLFGLKLSDCISTPWMYGSQGAQCKAGVAMLFSRELIGVTMSFSRKDSRIDNGANTYGF